MEDGTEQVRVQFVTKHEQYKVTETSIAVPLTLGRQGLSKIINHLLALKQVVPFDFLLVEKDVLVRRSLDHHINELGISTETSIKLEYAPAVQQPDLRVESDWPDWIAAVDARRTTADGAIVIATGSYDGSLQFASFSPGDPGSKDLPMVGKSEAHRSAVKSVCQFGEDMSATGSKDGLVKIFETSLVQSKEGYKGKPRLVATCAAHVGSVECVDAVSRNGHGLVASAGWDKALCVWNVKLNESEPEGETERSAKMRRTGENGEQSASKRVIKEPSVFFTDHTNNVSAVCWEDRATGGKLFSGSWDHSIRSWDVEKEMCVVQLMGSKVVSSLSYSQANQVLASGHADNCVRIWDARTTGDSVAKLQLRSHKGWVSSVRWSPTHPNMLLTGSYDNTIKVWDSRSSIPLHTLENHTSKVLSVDWSEDGSVIFSGGADSILRVHQMSL